MHLRTSHAVCLMSALLIASAGWAATITVDTSITYQTFANWAVTPWAGDDTYPAFGNYRDHVVDLAVNEMGITRVRLEVRSGAENPTDWYGLMIAGAIPYSEWRNYRYEVINDNADPNVMNAAGFHFTELDRSIQNMVGPMKAAVEANGDKLYVNLCYVDFGASTFEHRDNPADYGEYMLAVFGHMQQTYGWVPDGVEVKLEPDVGANQWSGAQVGAALVAAGDRLAAAGYTPDFIGPSNTSTINAATWFDQMIASQPRCLEYLTELSTHRYDQGIGGVDIPRMTALATRAATHGLQTSQLEKIGLMYQALHGDLKYLNVSTWQQFVLAGYAPDDGGKLYLIDDTDPNNPIITPGSRTPYLWHYFRFIRPGAVRVEALSGYTAYDPVAFQNPDGSVLAIIKATSGDQFVLMGMPAGRYGAVYTTATQTAVQLPQVEITEGFPLISSIPAMGVLTIYPIVEPSTPGDIDGDGDVDLDDFVIFKQNFGSSPATRAQGDLDGDNDVDLDDFVILKQNFGAAR